MAETKAKAKKEELTLQDIRKEIYQNENPIEAYNKIKESADKMIQAHWKAEEWDQLEELQAHLENLLMKIVDKLEKDKSLDNHLLTLFVKYDFVNKFNISVAEKETGEIVCKGRIKSIENISKLRKIGFYERRSTL